MKALVCGGCHYVNGTHVDSVLDKFMPNEIVCGGASGADDLAVDWAKRHGKVAHIYFPDWDTNGKAAGPMRNQKMLDEEKPDVVIAFPGGKGTDDTIRRANKAGVCVWASRDPAKETWDWGKTPAWSSYEKDPKQ